MTDLAHKSCRPCEGGVAPMTAEHARALLAQVPDWALDEPGRLLVRTFRFRNFYETMAFANAVAFVANREDHHPDLTLSYKECRVHYQTHAVGGLSENDFICAAKIDRLLT